MTRTYMIGCVILVGTLHAWGSLVAQDSSEPHRVHLQEQGGITVQLEKVTIERIYNESAWLEAAKRGTKQDVGKATADLLRQSLPAKVIKCFVSVVGETKMLGPTTIDFAQEPKRISTVSRFASPPKWQKRFPDLAVDPQASGIETQLVINGDTVVTDLFPAQIEVKVTTTEGKQLTFVFKHVNL